MIYYLIFFLFSSGVDNPRFSAIESLFPRSLLAAISSLLISLFIGPKIIRWLTKKEFIPSPIKRSPSLGQTTSFTSVPTMGGLIILASTFVSTLLWAKFANSLLLGAFLVTLWFGGIGAIDDWLKVTKRISEVHRKGLKPLEKIIFMYAGVLVIVNFLFVDFADTPDARMLWIPFCSHGIPITKWVFVLLAAPFMVAYSNAVNLCDGMDGLSCGCASMVTGLMAILCYLASQLLPGNILLTWAAYLHLAYIPGAGELCVFYMALMGATLGFLWFNCYPSQAFIGDVGTLSLGALIFYGAVITRHEILLIVAGGVFTLELLSVVLQVGYFKYTGGKRFFRCAPIHHHFLLSGWRESQVVLRMWLIGIICSLLALLALFIVF